MKNPNQVLEYILTRLDDTTDTQFAESITATLTDLVSAAVSKLAVVETVVDPTTDEKKTIESLVGSKFPTVAEFSYIRNKNLLGGIRIRVADQLLDNSLSSHLDALQNSLT